MANLDDTTRAYQKAVNTWTKAFGKVVSPVEQKEPKPVPPSSGVPRVVLDRYISRWVGDAD